MGRKQRGRTHTMCLSSACELPPHLQLSGVSDQMRHSVRSGHFA